jgi:hypothetical protein
MLRSLCGCGLAALLLVALPSVGQTAPASADRPTPEPPRVELGQIALGPDGAIAPLAGTREQASARLTLDPELQRGAQKLLLRARARAGAAIAVDVRSGRVLAFAERPRGVLLSARAPAASLFKIATAAALLERDAVGYDESNAATWKSRAGRVWSAHPFRRPSATAKMPCSLSSRASA